MQQAAAGLRLLGPPRPQSQSRDLRMVRCLRRHAIPPTWRWHSRPWTRTSFVRGPTGERSIPFTDFHRLPASTPERDNVLDRGDLIVAIEVPARIEGRASHYLKVRDRQSYEFALVSAAAAVATDGRRIRSARLGVGRCRAQAVAPHSGRDGAARGVARRQRRAQIGDRHVLRRCSPARPQRLQGRTCPARRAARVADRGRTRMNAIGQPISRADGRLKVTGGARYTADIPVAGAVHAAIVHSTIANGRTVSIDTDGRGECARACWRYSPIATCRA